MTKDNLTLVKNMKHVKWKEIPPLKGPDSQGLIKEKKQDKPIQDKNMADIDKTLPNNRPEDELIKEQMEEVDVADELGKGPVEITDEEDGGATIDFDPNAVQEPDASDPFANLNDLLPEDITDLIGSELQSDYAEYKNLSCRLGKNLYYWIRFIRI